MSSISFDGLIAYLVVIGMIITTILGLLVESINWLFKRNKATPHRSVFFAPISYGFLTILIILIDIEEPETANYLTLPIAVIGLIAWFGFRLYSRNWTK